MDKGVLQSVSAKKYFCLSSKQTLTLTFSLTQSTKLHTSDPILFIKEIVRPVDKIEQEKYTGKQIQSDAVNLLLQSLALLHLII